MSEAKPTIKKLLVAFDPAKPDQGAGNFLIPVLDGESVVFLGLRSKTASTLGRMVFIGKPITANDLFAKLVDTGRPIANVAQTVEMLTDYVTMLKEYKIGNVLSVVPTPEGDKPFQLRKIANTPSGAKTSG